MKYSMDCAYGPQNNGVIGPSAAARASAPAQGRHSVSKHASRSTNQHSSLHMLADAASAVDETPQSQGPYSLLHLELFHYFLSKTIVTLTRPDLVGLWRDTIPNYAYNRPWLMNGMIALGSLHRAHDEPSKASNHIALGIDLLNSGLPNLQTWVPNNEEPEDANAIVVYAALVGVYAVALPAVQHRRQPPEDAVGALLDAFDLIRGTAYVFEVAWSVVREGPLRAITQTDVFKNEDFDAVIHAPTPQRRRMLEMVGDLGDAIKASDTVPSDQREILKPAHDRLSRIAHNILMAPEQVPGNMALAWAAVLSAEFRGLMRDHYPPAITLLAYFSLLLIDDSWYKKGWRFWILDALSRMSLPEPWHGFLHWAEDQLSADADFLDIRPPEKYE